MVETEFSIVRYRGDKAAADKVYEGLQPCESSSPLIKRTSIRLIKTIPVTGKDIAEEIVWSAARPAHVNLAEVFVLPVNQASATLNYRAPK
jgi:3-hydroxy acid dehydrogenase / malonic semialdehyde reductase